MGSKLPPDEAALYRRLDEVLHYIWDPIGVAGAPSARDEYYAYLPGLFKLVKAHEPEERIVSYLLEVEAGPMGLSSPNQEKAQEVAGICTQWRSWIAEYGE